MTEILSWILPSLLMAAASLAFFYCAVVFVRGARQQHKLYNSIQLVELKRPRFYVLVALSIFTALIVFSSIALSNPQDKIYEQSKVFYMERLNIRICLGAVIIILSSFGAALSQQLFARAAIVDRGVYIGTGFIDWHNVYDYYVDSNKCTVILSRGKKGLLSGSTLSLRFSRQDLEKLEFILSKNRNKFTGFELK